MVRARTELLPALHRWRRRGCAMRLQGRSMLSRASSSTADLVTDRIPGADCGGTSLSSVSLSSVGRALSDHVTIMRPGLVNELTYQERP